MTELVETIAKALVDHPDRVEVTTEQDSRGEVIRLMVAGEDMGKVIGKNGRIARALRTVVKAAATRDNRNVLVVIDSEDEQEYPDAAPEDEGIAPEEAGTEEPETAGADVDPQETEQE